MKLLSKKRKYTIGIDLGGTKLAAALVDDHGDIVAFHKESILNLKKGTTNGPEKVVGLMVDLILNFKKNHPDAFNKKYFSGVGLASAGPLNVEQGELIYPVNFPEWKIVPIQKMLSDKLKKIGISSKVYFQNDAIAAARAEGWTGGAQDLLSYAVVTIGTGIGTGVIFNRQPVQTLGMGSEFGHLIARTNDIHEAKDLPLYTVEGISSGTGILRRALELGFKGSSIEELVLALDKGQTQYQILFDDAADTLAALCYNLSVGFCLQKILFSGGLIKVRRLYWKRLQVRYRGLIRQFNPKFECQLIVAHHLNQAGVLGAASLPYHFDSKKRAKERSSREDQN